LKHWITVTAPVLARPLERAPRPIARGGETRTSGNRSVTLELDGDRRAERVGSGIMAR